MLGIEDKGGEQARMAAAKPGPIDDVASWCAYKLDPAGEVRLLLDVAVEEIAHNLMEALRTEPTAAFNAPIGPSSESDSRLVDVANVAPGVHRITVKVPKEFAGWWVEFSRTTAPDDIQLNRP